MRYGYRRVLHWAFVGSKFYSTKPWWLLYRCIKVSCVEFQPLHKWLVIDELFEIMTVNHHIFNWNNWNIGLSRLTNWTLLQNHAKACWHSCTHNSKLVWCVVGTVTEWVACCCELLWLSECCYILNRNMLCVGGGWVGWGGGIAASRVFVFLTLLMTRHSLPEWDLSMD